MSEADCRQGDSDGSCCSADAPVVSEGRRLDCPACHEQGRSVGGQTVKAMLAVSLRAFEETAYRFCSTAGCAVVYYAEDGTHVFSVDDVRERVYQKEPSNPDILACYCFRRTIGEVVAASQEGRSAILRDITDGMRAGQCACDLRNPQGSCCLGNVRALAGKPESTAAGLPA